MRRVCQAIFYRRPNNETDFDEALIEEGLARDAIRSLQDLRKLRSCHFADRVIIYIVTKNPKLRSAIDNNRDFIAGETLAVRIETLDTELAGIEFQEVDLADEKVQIGLKVVS